MGNILIDVCAFSEPWGKKAIEELIANKNVKFLYTEQEKYKKEISEVIKLGNIMKVLIQTGRVVKIDQMQCDSHVKLLEENSTWKREQACDDPHLFAMSYLKPSSYILTSEKRLTDCRKCMRKVMDRKYGSFISVRSEKLYRRLKNVMMK